MRLQSSSTSGLLSRFRWDVELEGAKNGVNTIFKLPGGEKFSTVASFKIRVYMNGQRIQEGLQNDYTIREGGGPGSGFDTITLSVSPLSWERITADYLSAP